VKFPSPAQQVALQEYIDTIDEAERRVARLTTQIREFLPRWKRAGVVGALQALRGVSMVSATTLVAEIGDLTRFSNPRELRAYLGLVASDYSSGAKMRRGAITKAGNSHVRRVLDEAAWAYRGRARVGQALGRRAWETQESELTANLAELHLDLASKERVANRTKALDHQLLALNQTGGSKYFRWGQRHSPGTGPNWRRACHCAPPLVQAGLNNRRQRSAPSKSGFPYKAELARP
jgi:hypothetical protein